MMYLILLFIFKKLRSELIKDKYALFYNENVYTYIFLQMKICTYK